MDTTYKYVPFTTKSKQPDGTLLVAGRISDDSLDLDGQRVNAEWLEKAASQWFKDYANIREMHQPVAIGKAVEMTQDGTAFDIVAKIVDPLAITKFDNDIYTGFSIGIKGTRTDRSQKALASAPNGIINGGSIIEVSAVDVPANPNAVRFSLAKAAGIDDAGVESVVDGAPPCSLCQGIGQLLLNSVWTKCDKCDGTGDGEIDVLPSLAPGPENHGEVGKAATYKPTPYKRDPGETVQCPKCDRFNDTDAHYCDQCGFKLDGASDVEVTPDTEGAAKMAGLAESLGLLGESTKAAEPGQWTHDPELLKQVSEGISACISQELQEQLDGDDERWDLAQLLDSLNTFLSWWQGEALEGETVSPFDDGDDDMDLTTLGVSADTVKAAKAEGATEDDRKALAAEVVKALGLDEMIATSQEDLVKKAQSLTERLEVVEKMRASREYALRASEKQQESQSRLDIAERELATLKAAQASLTTPDDRLAYEPLVVAATQKVASIQLQLSEED